MNSPDLSFEHDGTPSGAELSTLSAQVPSLCPLCHTENSDNPTIVIGLIGATADYVLKTVNELRIVHVEPCFRCGAANFVFDKNITFLASNNRQTLFVHFASDHNNNGIYHHLHDHDCDEEDTANHDLLLTFRSSLWSQFAKYLLFGLSICHIVVLIETGTTFDVSHVSLFKMLKNIREKYVSKFVPKFLKHTHVGSLLGHDGRLCSPRLLFCFEKSLAQTNKDLLRQLEFEIEDDIYKMLRNEFIITDNTSASLLSIPRNKEFVFINAMSQRDDNEDVLIDYANLLFDSMERQNKKASDDDEELDSIRPFAGFSKPLLHSPAVEAKKNSNAGLMHRLSEHINEALRCGFDDSNVKYRGTHHVVTPSQSKWFAIFQSLHNILIASSSDLYREMNDPDYKMYSESYETLIDFDHRFLVECCETGLEHGLAKYDDAQKIYRKEYHKKQIAKSVTAFETFARGSKEDEFRKKLEQKCNQKWKNQREQCEQISLRGNKCIQPKHLLKNPFKHESGVLFTSACNCGLIQGQRKDPFNLRKANYEFYQLMTITCALCSKLEIQNFFSIQPSEQLNLTNPEPIEEEIEECSVLFHDKMRESRSMSLTMSQQSISDIKLDIDFLDNQNMDRSDGGGCDKMSIESETSNSLYHIPGVIEAPQSQSDKMKSPKNVFTKYPDWSLLCIGSSTIYSHNSGLPEHIQCGFLNGANFLIPWNVRIRFQHSSSMASFDEKPRHRKKPTAVSVGSVFDLKIFIGCEFECPRGHRFILLSPDKVMTSAADIQRDSGKKIAMNDMPLYFPCPCRNTKSMVAQMMRIHVVTPKAPVNIILDVKVKVGNQFKWLSMTGLSEPPKLSQSSYWILRLPYVYEGEDGPILPPTEVNTNSALEHGYLAAGIFRVEEIQPDS